MRIRRNLRLLFALQVLSLLAYATFSIAFFFAARSASFQRLASLLQGQRASPMQQVETDGLTLATLTAQELLERGLAPGAQSPQRIGSDYVAFSPVDQAGERYAYVRMEAPLADEISSYALAVGLPSALALFSLSAYATWRVDKRGILPLARQIGRLSEAEGVDPNPFLNEADASFLLSAVRGARAKIDEMKGEIEGFSEKTLAILDGLPNGLILLNPSLTAPILINKVARSLFDRVFPESPSQETDKRLERKIATSLKAGKDAFFDWERNGKTYSVIVDVISKKGGAIFFADVTEERKIEETKRDFFIYASHQMKTPLTSVIGYLEMITSHVVEDPKEVEGIAFDALAEARKLRDMIRDMLDLSRVESTRARNVEDVDVAEVAEDVLSSLKEMVREHGVRLIKDLQECVVRMDRNDCEKLLTNLVANGIKYNRPGGYVVVSVNGERRSLVVRDSGVGIPQEDLHRVFERFFRASNVKGDGTGLGLSIVKHVVQRYGFSIDLTSAVGIGSTFAVKF